jgi:hypothetical protein
LFGTDKWYIAILPRINAPISIDELHYGSDFLAQSCYEEIDENSATPDNAVSATTSWRSTSFNVGSLGTVTNRYNVNVYHPFAKNSSNNALIEEHVHSNKRDD